MSRRISLILVCLLFSVKLFASHLAGGEIFYEYSGSGNNYRIFCKIYSPCGAMSIGSYTYISTKSVSCNIDTSYTASLIKTDTVKEMFCTPGTGCGTDFRYNVVYTYFCTANLVPCNDWIISSSSCCLNGQVLNISYTTTNWYAEAFLNNSVAINNSAIIKNYPPFYVGLNAFYTNTIQSVDADNDSVVTQYIQPYNDASTVVSYQAGFSILNPIASTYPMHIDTANHDMQLLSISSGNYYVGMRTTEYRNGVIVGYSNRQWMLTSDAVAMGKNPLPAPGTNFSYLTHLGQTQTITLNFNDSTSSDSVFVSFEPSNSWTYTTSTSPDTGTGSGSITWTTPSTLNPADTPYFYIYVLAKTNACPVNGYAWYTILVHTALVNPNDSVWAGDANSDYTANMYDPLAIAVAYGQTGPVRSGATTSWTPEYCANWASYFLPVM